MAIIFDLESDGLLDKLTKIHCLCIRDTESGDSSSFTGDDIGTGLLLLAAAPMIVGHNILAFDIPAIQKLHPWFKPSGVVRDTLVLSRLIWSDRRERDGRRKTKLPPQLVGRHSLESWGYRLGVLKGDFGKTTDWQECTPEMVAYCERDVEVTALLWDKILKANYSEFAVQLEHDFAEILILQERHGFRFDREKAIALYAVLAQRRLELEAALAKACPGWWTEMKTPDYWFLVSNPDMRFPNKSSGLALGFKGKDMARGPNRRKHTPFNPSSRDHVARFLTEKYGWKPLQFGDDGKPTIDEDVLAALPYSEARLLSESFLVDKRIGQVAEGAAAWLRLERNGRIHGHMNGNGAVTGRCTHSSPNVGQVPSCKVPYGTECRSCWCVGPGMKLVGADVSGLELRCLAHYMAIYDGGAYVKAVVDGKKEDGTEVHSLNCRALGMVPTMQYVINGHHTTGRDCAKTFIYAYIYGGGDGRIGSIVGKGAAAGKRLKAAFLAQTPGLAQLKAAVAKAVRERGYLVGLDGRRIPVRSDHSALNTLLQGAGAVIVKLATVLLHKDLLSLGWQFGREWAQVAHVHDELQNEVMEQHAEEVGKRAVAAMQRAGEILKLKCPITGEYKIGNNWAECH